MLRSSVNTLASNNISQRIQGVLHLRMISWQTYSSWLIGLGMIFFIWHNLYQPLINYVFIPQLGMMMIIAGIVVTFYKTEKKFFELGDKRLWIPLVVIAGSIVMAAITARVENRINMQAFGSQVMLAVMLFCCYLSARQLGKQIFTPFAWAVVIEAVSIIWYGAVHQWMPNGGLLSNTNYDIAIGLLIFGLVVSWGRKQYWLVGFALAGVYFSGAAEGLFVVAGLGLYWIWRNWKMFRYIPKKNLVFTGVIGCLLVVALLPVSFQPIWQDKLVDRIISAWQGLTTGHLHNLYYASGYRAFGNWALSPIKIFGYGININHFYVGIQHNIVLIIIEQVGIIAAIAWLAAWWFGFKQTIWKYAWLAMLLMGVFDHFVWSQAAPYFWVLAGVSSLEMAETKKLKYVGGIN